MGPEPFAAPRGPERVAEEVVTVRRAQEGRAGVRAAAVHTGGTSLLIVSLQQRRRKDNPPLSSPAGSCSRCLPFLLCLQPRQGSALLSTPRSPRERAAFLCEQKPGLPMVPGPSWLLPGTGTEPPVQGWQELECCRNRSFEPCSSGFLWKSSEEEERQVVQEKQPWHRALPQQPFPCTPRQGT